MGEATWGERVYAVRSALGTKRKALPLREFAELLTAQAAEGRQYYASTLSDWERGGGPKPTIEDAECIAAVDPLRRGAAWLAFGGGPAGSGARFLADMEQAAQEHEAQETAAQAGMPGGRRKRG